MTEEEKQNFKKNISQLNTMLKKMVPLYALRLLKVHKIFMVTELVKLEVKDVSVSMHTTG